MKKKCSLIPEKHPLTWRIRDDKQPVWLKEYQSKNGYNGIRKVLKYMSSNEVVSLVNDSNLRGRGGAGFLTGLKWSMLHQDKSVNEINIRYLLCNADEMEPGTYKDRFLIERLPHLLLEGILIAGYAIQATHGYIFLRYEYVDACLFLRRAIAEITEIGLLGVNILGSGFNFELCIHTGAGRYICGEETALINSLEGKRAIPRSKPPFPSSVGLWGYPTCVNNVETLCNLPAIVEHGVNWYKNISSRKSLDTGTKLMGFSGKVKNPGVWEFPFGTLAQEILEDYAGGMCSGLTLKAWQPGGASTAFLTHKHLNVGMDFQQLSIVGSRLGTAISIAIDNTVNIVSLLHNLEVFFARESCGWCTPCRDGLPWIVKLLASFEDRSAHPMDIQLLQELCNTLSIGKTFCAHAPGAIEPLRSALKYFRNEFDLGILVE